MQDIRFALRTLRTQPVFTLAAIATLTIGIGACTAIFSIVYQVLIRPLPYAQPDRLVWVWNTYGKAGEDRTAVSIPDYLDRKASADAIGDATLFTGRAVALTGRAQPEQVRALVVTASFFPTLGRSPIIGRAFTDDEAATARVAVLMHGFWRSRFNADPGIVGRDVQLNGEAWRVLGVMPDDFRVPVGEASTLLPFAFTPAQRSDQERGNEFSFMIARLRPGRTAAQFDQQIARSVEQAMARVPARAAYMRTSNFGGRAVPLRERMAGDLRTPLYVLQAAVVVVLLIACANVANLLLMRANRRAQEIAIRSALGAGRLRIARQLIVEGLVLSIVGAAGGVGAARAGVRFLIALSDTRVPVIATASLEWPVLMFAVALALVTGVGFGIAPAANVAIIERGLRDGGRATGGRRSGAVRSVLVVAETALALILLVAAGLLIKSFARVLAVDPGFTTSSVVTAQVSLPRPRYAEPSAQQAFWAALVARLRNIPGVSAAGLTSSVPFAGIGSGGTYRISSRPLFPDEKPLHAQLETVGGDYFRALRIPVLEGRVFTDADRPEKQRVVIVDELLVRRQFPGRSPIGERLTFGSERSYEIVGVVGTVSVADPATPVPEERVYFSVNQLPERSMGIVAKTMVEPSSVVAQIRSAVQALDPGQPIAEVRTLDQWLERSLQPRRTPMTLLGLFGAAALALAAVGIYGVLAFSVTERAREFGIRQALGADRRAILSMALAQGIRPAAAGIAVGIAGSFAATRYLQSMLYGVERSDVVVLSEVSAVLFTVALGACYLPARWATRVDPMVALREG